MCVDSWQHLIVLRWWPCTVPRTSKSKYLLRNLFSQVHCSLVKSWTRFVCAAIFLYTPQKIHMWLHEKTRCRSKIAILDNAHLKVPTLCYFMRKSDLPNGDKITSVGDNALFCFLHSVLLFLYLSVLLKSNFLKKWKSAWFSRALSHVLRPVPFRWLHSWLLRLWMCVKVLKRVTLVDREEVYLVPQRCRDRSSSSSSSDSRWAFTQVLKV